MNNKPRRILCVMALLMALAAGGIACGQAWNPNDTRTTMAIKDAFGPVVRAAAMSTVKVNYENAGKKPVQAALGTIISADGYILTKASEILGRDKITVRLPKGPELEAAIVGYNQTLDLAMLKVKATGLTPVVFADTRAPDRVAVAAVVATAPATAPGGTVFGGGLGGGLGGARRGGGGPRTIVVPVVATVPAPPAGAIAVNVGEWVATPDAAGSAGADLPPKAVGVISTSRRVVPQEQGFLGVGLANASAGGVRITEVVEDSGAQKAGLKVDDVVKAIEGRSVKASDELSTIIRSYAAGDAVRLYVLRGGETLVVRAVLGENVVPTAEEQTIVLVSGGREAISGRATFSPFVAISSRVEAVTEAVTVFEHDTILSPSDMGGPLVDLEGRVIGINIARAGRTETFALPADIVVPTLERLKSGLFAPLPAKPPENP